jgi:hypothetical protein
MSSSRVRVQAKSTFEGTKFDSSPERRELSFVAGECFIMTHIDEQAGWGKGLKANGEMGWFPIAFTSRLEPDPPLDPVRAQGAPPFL